MTTFARQMQPKVLKMLKTKVGSYKGRLLTNWCIERVVVRASTDRDGGTLYVNVTVANIDNIVFFDDLVKLEKQIKKDMKGATNFCLKMVSQRHNRVEFSFLVPTKTVLK